MANQNPLKAATSVVAAATNTGNAVSGDGEVDTVKYGHVLGPDGWSVVRGAGLSYDGLLHRRLGDPQARARGRTPSGFRISREGTGTTSPVVRP